MKNIGKFNLGMLSILAFVFLVTILAPSNVFAATASINTNVTTMQTNESANITVSVADTEAYKLTISASGGSLSGDTTVLDEGNGTEVSKTALTSTFTASTPGTYTITLTGQITGSDLVKQNINKTATIKVVEPVQEPEQPSTPEQPQQNDPTPEQPSTPTVKKSSDASISSFTATANNKSLDVSQDSTRYTATIESDVNAVTFTIKTSSSKATIDSNKSTSGIGFVKNSESAGQKTYTMSNLKEGNNVIKITVKAEDGTEKNYTFAVTKKVAENPQEETVVPNIDEEPMITSLETTETPEKTTDTGLGLKSLVITGTQISPAFSLTTYEYTATISGSDSVEVIALPTDEEATVEIVGNKNLVNGENLITILVKKGDDVKTYQIILTKTDTAVAGTAETNDSPIPGLSWKHIAIIAAAILVAIAVIIRITTMSKKTIDEDIYAMDTKGKKNRKKFKEEDVEAEVENNETEIETKTEHSDKKGKRFK